MQNAGLQYGEGVTPVQESPFASAQVQNGSSNSTASLRQFRKKDNADKTNGTLSAANQDAANSSHVARVAPHNHYPHKQNEYFRYPTQYSDYSTPYKEPTVKYSEIAEPVIQPIPHLDHLPPSVLTKHKEKEYVEMCNIPQQSHLGKSYPEHQFNGQQAYPPPDVSMHHQYMHKEPQASQMHPSYKPESQYIPKEGTFNHQMHPFLKYNIPQSRNYGPLENTSLTPFQRMDPHLARSFMSDHHHHIREFPADYGPMEQTRMYAQKQRYYPTPLPPSNSTYPSNYPHRNMAAQQYNYPSCNYPRSTQMNPSMGRYAINMERSISPRRTYAENIDINFAPVPQKMQPGYPNYPAYSQHYQQRRPPAVPQEYYHAQQHPRTQYMSNHHHHHHHAQEMPENHVASNNIRQYLENWAEEEPTGELPASVENPKYIPRMAREETNEVYVINASELPQYLENGVPLIASENGQYIFKSNVSIDNTGAIKILEKTGEVPALTNDAQERIVSLHIIENPKSDCLVNSKPNAEPPTINVVAANLENPPRTFNNGYGRVHQDSPRAHAPSPEKPISYNEVPSTQNRLNFDESLLPHPVPCDAKKKTPGGDDDHSVISNVMCEEAILKEAHEELDKIVQDTLTSTNIDLPLENCERHLPKPSEDHVNSRIPDYLNLDLDTHPKDLRLTPPDVRVIDLSTNSRRTSKNDEEITNPVTEKEDNETMNNKSSEEDTKNEEGESSVIKHMPLIFDSFEDNTKVDPQNDCLRTEDKNKDSDTQVTVSEEEGKVLTEENEILVSENQGCDTKNETREEYKAVPNTKDSPEESEASSTPEKSQIDTTEEINEEQKKEETTPAEEIPETSPKIKEEETKIEEVEKAQEIQPSKDIKDEHHEDKEEEKAEVAKSGIKRKRIFSVDDIIYRIGSSNLAPNNPDRKVEKTGETKENNDIETEKPPFSVFRESIEGSEMEEQKNKNEDLNANKDNETREDTKQLESDIVENDSSVGEIKEKATPIQEVKIKSITEQARDETKEMTSSNEMNNKETLEDDIQLFEDEKNNTTSNSDEEIEKITSEENKDNEKDSQDENLAEKETFEDRIEEHQEDENHSTNEMEISENSVLTLPESTPQDVRGDECSTSMEEESLKETTSTKFEDRKTENLKRSLSERSPTEARIEETDESSQKRIKLDTCEHPEEIETKETTANDEETTKTNVREMCEPNNVTVEEVVMVMDNTDEEPIAKTSEISKEKEENVTEPEEKTTKCKEEQQISEITEVEVPKTSELNKESEDRDERDQQKTEKDSKNHTKEAVTFEQKFVEPLLKNRSPETERSDRETEEEDKTPTEGYQYRTVLKIEENVVLLEISGELVEISVNQISGKKVITVVPLSNAVTVDINDNYEHADRASVNDHNDQSNRVDSGQAAEIYEETCAEYSGNQTFPISHTQGEEEKVLRNEEITSTQAETVENTEEIFEDSIMNENEIIIGDESLEEEINLDLKNDETLVEEKPVICTKAALKIYEDAPSVVISRNSSLREFRKVKTKQQSVQDVGETSGIHKKLMKRSSARVKGGSDLKGESRDALQELIKQRKMRKEKIRLKYSQYMRGDSQIMGDTLDESEGTDEATQKEVRSEVRNVFKLDQGSMVHKVKSGGDVKRRDQLDVHGTKTKGKEKNRRRSVDDGREKIHLIASVIVKESTQMNDTERKKPEEKPTSTSHLLPDQTDTPAQNFQGARPTPDTDLVKNHAVQGRHAKFPKTSISRDLSLTKNVNEHYLSRKDHSNLKKKLSIQEYNSRKRKMGAPMQPPPCAEKAPRTDDETKGDGGHNRPGTIYSGRLFENVCVKDPRRLQFINCENGGFSRSNSQDSTFSRMPNISLSRSLSTGSATTQSSMTADYLLNKIPPHLNTTCDKLFERKVVDTTSRRKSLDYVDRKFEASEHYRRKVSFDDNVQINEIHTTQPKPAKMRQESSSGCCEVTSSCSENFEEKSNRTSDDSYSDETNSRSIKSIQMPENDWEDSNSPKDCITDAFAECFLDKNKLETVKNTRNKLIIDINDFDTTSIDNELKSSYRSSSSSSVEGTINYKEEVDLKLNSLNIHIPKIAKTRVSNEDDILMHKFLRKEQLSSDEIKQIRRIIYFKKKMQQLQKQQSVKAPEENYEIRNSPESSMKLQLKKVDGKVRKKKKRFRNLYSDSPDTSENEIQETAGEFSVYEGENISGVKLIFKRKTDFLNLQPVVKLQRCKHLDAIAKKLKS